MYQSKVINTDGSQFCSEEFIKGNQRRAFDNFVWYPTRNDIQFNYFQLLI